MAAYAALSRVVNRPSTQRQAPALWRMRTRRSGGRPARLVLYRPQAFNSGGLLVYEGEGILTDYVALRIIAQEAASWLGWR